MLKLKFVCQLFVIRFLSYYTWFSSVYMFCIFVFPWCYKPFFAAKNDRTALCRLAILWVLALYLYVAIFSIGLTAIDNEATLNWYESKTESTKLKYIQYSC